MKLKQLGVTRATPPADLRQTSGRPPAGTFTSNIPPPPPPPGALLRPPRVGFSASAGFSASTGLSAFLAPRVAFSGTGVSTFTGLPVFLSFLAADFDLASTPGSSTLSTTSTAFDSTTIS